MRRSTIGLAIGTLLLGVLSMIVASGAAAAPLTSTTLVTVRPVTAAGHAAPGYTITTPQGASPVDCSFPDASPAAVDKDIQFCGPSAAEALACWRSATAHRVLCLMDATAHKLVNYRAAGKIAHAAAPKTAAPLNVRLAGGTVCTLRDGGAGVNLQQHPNWGATYYCTGGRALWAPLNSKTFGINRAHKVWTVQIASDSGKQPVRTAEVAKAWVVGTHA